MFQYLDLFDLCAVADVCHRFRQNAKPCFAHSKKKDLNVKNDIIKHGNQRHSLNQVILKISKILRNFGEFIAEFEDRSMTYPRFDCACWGQPWAVDLFPRAIYVRSFIELLVRYSSKNLTKFDLCVFELCDGIASTMGPLFGGLHRLELSSIEVGEVFLRKWPLWSAELRVVRFHEVSAPQGQVCFLRHPFPKLVKISIVNIKGVSPNDIAEMLKYNPQLKEIEIRGSDCELRLLNILPLIVEHVPEVESLTLRFEKDNPEDLGYVKYLIQLSELSSLTLEQHRSFGTKCLASAIRKMVAANIPIKYLRLCNLCLSLESGDFVNAVSKLKQLETMRLVINSGPYYIFPLSEVLKTCSKLTTLHLLLQHVPTILRAEKILTLIRCSEKLQSLVIKMSSVIRYSNR